MVVGRAVGSAVGRGVGAKHVAEEAGESVPAGHGVHKESVSPAALNVPAAHGPSHCEDV